MTTILLGENDGYSTGVIEALPARSAGEIELTTVTTIADAHACLNKCEFDLILLDLNLTGEDRTAHIEKIQSKWPMTPIIVLVTDEDQAIAAVKAGAEDYLLKDDTYDKLLPRSIRYAMGLAMERKNSAKKYQELEQKLSVQPSTLGEEKPSLGPSDRRVIQFYNEMPVLLHSINDEGAIINASNYWLKHMGYDRAEVIGKDIVEFMDEKSKLKALEINLPQFFKTGFCQDLPYVFIKKNGDKIDAVLSAIAERDENGNILNALAIVVDITAYNKTMEQLRKSEIRFKEFAESAADRFWEMDENFRFTYISDVRDSSLNPAIEEIVGKTRWEIPGIDVTNQIWLQHKADLEAHLPIRDFVYKRILEDQHETWIRVSAKPIFDEFENFKGYRGTNLDISSEIKIQNENEITQQLFNDAIESISDAITLYDSNDLFVIGNSQARKDFAEIEEYLVRGTTLVEILKAFESRVLMPIKESDKKWVEQTLKSHQRLETQKLQQYKDGRWFLVNRHQTTDGGTLVIRTDVSKQKQAEEELTRHRDHLKSLVQEQTSELIAAKETAEMANRTKSDFLANMSHEFRTPLNAIIGFSDIIRTELLGPLENQQYKGYATDINDSGLHLLNLINDLLDVSVIESGKLVLHDEAVPLEAVTYSALRMVISRAAQGKVHLKNLVDSDAPVILADPLRIKQILVNLISNAVKFTPPEGSVSIKTEISTDNYVLIFITDTGIGMDDAKLATALERFGQVARENPLLSDEGTGLGLPLTKGYVEAHGGTLEIASELNKGTTVTIRIPPERVLKSDPS